MFSGYCIYDLLISIAVLRVLPVSTFVHHVTGAWGALAMCMYKQASFFPCVFLITELTVPVSIGSWFARQRDSHRHTNRRWMWARAVSFLCLRAFLAPLSLWYAKRVYDRQHGISRSRRNEIKQKVLDAETVPLTVSTATEETTSFGQAFRDLPPVVKYGTAFNLTVMGALNLYWTLTMFRQLRVPSSVLIRE